MPDHRLDMAVAGVIDGYLQPALFDGRVFQRHFERHRTLTYQIAVRAAMWICIQ